MSYESNIDDAAVDRAVRQVQEGKAAPFEVVVRRYERPLRAWLAVQAPPGIDVEEIAQRAFVTAYGRISDYSAGTNLGGCPRWTKDGKAVIYHANTTGKGRLFLYTLADGSTKQVSTDDSNDFRYPHVEDTPKWPGGRECRN